MFNQPIKLRNDPREIDLINPGSKQKGRLSEGLQSGSCRLETLKRVVDQQKFNRILIHNVEKAQKRFIIVKLKPRKRHDINITIKIHNKQLWQSTNRRSVVSGHRRWPLFVVSSRSTYPVQCVLVEPNILVLGRPGHRRFGRFADIFGDLGGFGLADYALSAYDHSERTAVP